MRPVFPQLLGLSDVALLYLRLVVAVVFFESGRRHAGDPVGRAGFWGDKTYGWHYDLLFLVASLVILTTGGRLVLL